MTNPIVPMATSIIDVVEPNLAQRFVNCCLKRNLANQKGGCKGGLIPTPNGCNIKSGAQLNLSPAD